MSEPIKVDVKLTAPIPQPESPRVFMLSNSMLTKLGRWDVATLWHQRIMARIAALEYVDKVGTIHDSFLIDVKATPDHMPDLVALGLAVSDILQTTPFVPPAEEADALEYLHTHWKSHRHPVKIYAHDLAEFEKHAPILVERYRALEQVEGYPDFWYLSPVGKLL